MLSHGLDYSYRQTDSDSSYRAPNLDLPTYPLLYTMSSTLSIAYLTKVYLTIRQLEQSVPIVRHLLLTLIKV